MGCTVKKTYRKNVLLEGGVTTHQASTVKGVGKASKGCPTPLPLVA